MTADTTDTGDILLRAIHCDPADDTSRLVYADWLTDNDQPERAAFIRCQIELAAIPDPPPEPSVGMRAASRSHRLAALHVWSMQWKTKYYALRQRERELQSLGNCIAWFTAPGTAISWTASEGLCGWYTADGSTIRTKLSRGFVSSLTCTAADWLRYADAVFWHPEQTVECRCRGRCDYPRTVCTECGEPVERKKHYDQGNLRTDPVCHRHGWRSTQGVLYIRTCPHCDSTGYIPRPFVATVQPLERVELTTVPEWDEWGRTTARALDPVGPFHTDRWPGIVFTVRPQEMQERPPTIDPGRGWVFPNLME